MGNIKTHGTGYLARNAELKMLEGLGYSDPVKGHHSVLEEVSDRFEALLDCLTVPEMETAARLFKKVRPTTSGCLEWSGCKTHGGYGTITVFNIRWSTHRLSWTVFNGPIPNGLHVLHKCDNPSCVHPDHLFVGEHKDNMRDASVKRKQRYGLTDEPSPTDIHTENNPPKYQDIKSY
jgi:hypothetical protein